MKDRHLRHKVNQRSTYLNLAAPTHQEMSSSTPQLEAVLVVPSTAAAHADQTRKNEKVKDNREAMSVLHLILILMASSSLTYLSHIE